MRARYTIRGLDRAARRRAKTLLDALAERIDALVPRDGDSGSFQVWLRGAERTEARAVVHSWLGVVYADATGDDVTALVERLEGAIVAELRRRRRSWNEMRRSRGAAAHGQLASARPTLTSLRSHERRADFDELMQALLGPLRAYAQREVELATPAVDTLDVDDLLDEVLLEAWEQWDEIGTASLNEWLLTRLHERIDTAAVESRGPDPVSLIPNPSDDDWVHDNARFWPEPERLSVDDLLPGQSPDPYDLVSAFEGVAPLERRALLLREAEGLSDEEIASVLERDPDTVGELVERAMDKLRASAQR